VERYDDWRALLIDALEQNVPTAYAPAMITSLVDALRGEQSEAAAQLARRCLEHPGLLEDEREIGLIPQGFTALVCLDRLDAVEDLAAQLLASARARGSIQGFLTGLSFEAWASARRGRLIEAQAALDNVLAQIQEHGLVFIVPSALTYATDNALERPDAEAVAGLALSLELPPDFARTLSGGMALLARGQVKYASGDREGAERDLRACGEILQPLRFVNPNALAWRSALALATSDPVEARELVEADLGLARRIGQARGIGLALRRLGLIAGGSDGIDALREAVSVLESSPARLEHARALVSLGSSLRRAGARREAREHLSAGLELARECGAVRLADRAREELLASGARPRREVRRGIDALTPSEVRVAQLAARGASNPEIAQALFVTRNTVETHMRHIFQKLEISSRSELGGALAQLLSSPELS
jgi:DNA-binding NarL/FixJ family response regulator